MIYEYAALGAAFNGAAAQTSAFTQLNQGLFQNTGADADASVLFGTDVNLLDNPLDNLLGGFFSLGGSAFTSVALS